MSDTQINPAATTRQQTRRARLILNPEANQVAGDGDIAERMRVLLSPYQISVDIAVVTPERGASDLAREAAQDGVDFVLAVGGDGTVHQVATGMMHTEATLGIIPLGTMNNIAYSLNIPDDLEGACKVIGQGIRRKIDIGLINSHPFLEIVSVGAEATFFPLAESLRHKGIWGAIRAAVEGLGMLIHLQRHPVTIELDGKRKRFHAWQVTVCNSPVYGLRFSAAPDARMDDGLLDVVIARYGRRWDLVRHYRSIMTGDRVPHLRNQVHRARRIRISSKDRLPVAVDSVPQGETPVAIAVAHHALNVMTGAQRPAETTEPTLSPLATVMRSIAAPETENDKLHGPQETAQNMRNLTHWYWVIIGVLASLMVTLRTLRIWPFQPMSDRPPARPRTVGRPWLEQLTASAIGLIFLRLGMMMEVIGFIISGLLSPCIWLIRWLQRDRTDPVVPDEGIARAVAGTGILAAGLWASRKPTWRRNTLLGLLGAAGVWFASVGRHQASSPARTRDNAALGLAIGAAWLGVSLNLIIRIQRSVVRFVGGEIGHHADASTLPMPSDAVVPDGLDVVPVAVMQPLERGDLVLFGPDGSFGSGMIEFLTRSHYHHIAIYDGNGMVIEAMPEGVNRYVLGNRRVTGIRPPVSKAQREAAADWARGRSGDRYDVRGLLLIAFDRLFPGMRLGSQAANRFSCAVFIADAYLHAGVDLLPGMRWQDLIPGDFMALLDRQPLHQPVRAR